MGELIQFPQHENIIYDPKNSKKKINKDNIIEVNFSSRIKEADFEVAVNQLISLILYGVSGKFTPCVCEVKDTYKEIGKYTIVSTFDILKHSVSPTNHEYNFTEKHFKEASKFFEQNNVGNFTWKHFNATKNKPERYSISLNTFFDYIELREAFGDEADSIIGTSYTVHDTELIEHKDEY